MKTRILFIYVFLILTPFLCVAAETRLRPDDWATPVVGTSLKNWYKVSDKIYRSEQPSKKEFNAVQDFGIKAVLNLRKYHSDKDETKKLSLKLYRHKMSAGKTKYQDLVATMRIIKNEEGPILIHCMHGSDRTGLVIATYRILFENWSKEKAIDEMINGGYGFHSIYDNIPKLIKRLDVEKLKKDVFK